MSLKTFRLPPDIGAANVQVFGPDGQPVTTSTLATTGESIPFDVRAPGVFRILVDPIGEEARLLTFEVDDFTPEELSEPSFPTSDRRGGLASLEILPEPPPRLPAQPAKPTRAARSSGAAGWDEIVKLQYPLSKASRAVDLAPWEFEPVERHVTVGLSYDAEPLAPGGWRPFHGPWHVTVSPESSETALVVRREAASQPLTLENARLRVHVAVEKQKALRLLVPMFLGGVKVTVRIADSDVSVAVRPLDPTLHVLMQAFDAGSEADPLALLDRVARSGSGALDDDPWATVVFGMLAQRKHPDAYSLDLANEMARRFRWMADASILAGNRGLADQNPDVGLALEHLSHAMRIGAPYFKATNALLGDLLVTLAADAPEVEHRRKAATQLSLWRRRIPFQVAAGPYFAWLMRGGARSGRTLDARYHRTMFRGVYKLARNDPPFPIGQGGDLLHNPLLDQFRAPDAGLDSDDNS